MKVYRFDFSGEVKTLADFMARLSSAAERMETETRVFVPIDIEGDRISLGVESMGHAGGYWYEFNPIPVEGGVLIAGKMHRENRVEYSSSWEKLLFGLGTLAFLLPMGVSALLRAIGRSRRLRRFLVDFVGCKAAKKPRE